jgi:hypothetical protein
MKKVQAKRNEGLMAKLIFAEAKKINEITK